ncbi:cyclophane-forming radical SAM peptide maturase AmcB [Kitasatospora sp. NPDC057542]|uniref:cyclophane-forming radical SAM peptide maturase AmcB n=1 Tax=Kitasatospora sp. NPDC057542 TaxID=3346162 RepID=UPI0036B7A147
MTDAPTRGRIMPLALGPTRYASALTTKTMPALRYRARIARRPRSVVAQPTSLCNLACLYCYLPHRHRRNHMPVPVAQALAQQITEITELYPGPPITLIWHAGEPMALGIRRFAELLEPFDRLLAAGQIEHALQTNATLVTDSWCDLLARYRVRVGVSVDGPQELNGQRVDWAGRPAFRHIMRGIRRLQARGIPFSVISVVGRETIGDPEVMLDFLAGLSPTSIGLNIEEEEGANTDRTPPSRGEALTFWRRVIAWNRRRPGTPIVRELDQLGRYLQFARTGTTPHWERVLADPIPTVATTGDVVLLSPELAGISSRTYNDFVAGNITERPLSAILADAHHLPYVQEYLNGVDQCERSCDVYEFCRGSQAGNRYFEHGRFDTAETNYCRVSEQALVEALAETAREETTAR